MMRAGAVLAHRKGLVRSSPAGVREQGIDTAGFPRNLGRPIVSISRTTGLWRGCQTQNPGPQAGVGLARSDEHRRKGW